MTREEIEKLPAIIDVLLSESVIADTKEKLHEKLTEVCNLAIKGLEQEPKKGHWEHDRANVRCSNCGKGYKNAFGRTSAITYNYCPNCGSRNEVEE